MTEIDAFLDDLDRLAAAAPTGDPSAFYSQLLPAAAAAIGGDAAVAEPCGGDLRRAAWVSGGGATPPLVDRATLDRVRAGGPPRVINAPDNGGPVAACPIGAASGVVGVLGIRLAASASADATRSLGVAIAVAEVASRYETRREAERIAGDRSRLASIQDALIRLHSARGVTRVAEAVVDAGRAVVGCDRLAVLIRRGGRWRVQAVSGADRLNRRGDAVRRMRRLATAAARWEHPVRLPSVAEDYPPSLRRELDRYSDATGARSLTLLPVRRPGEHESSPEGVLLAEWFGAEDRAEAQEALAAWAGHAAVALRRERKRLSAVAGPLTAGAAAATVAAVLTVVLLFMQATLWVVAEGRFVHADRARVFAPHESVVQELLVGEGDRVEAGQLLARLDSPELRIRLEEVAEAITGSEAEIETLRTARLRASLPGAGSDSADPTALASRIAAVREVLDRQRRRQELLRQELKRLEVRSPIGGVVVSWRPEESLARRPVSRGERLLEIAREDVWSLEIDLPDHRSGRVLTAASSGDLSVEYVVRADPSRTHRATVSSIAETTHADPAGDPIVRVVATPEDASRASARSGLGVSAKIDCGEHSLGYVWLHEAIDAIRRRFF